MKKGGTNKRLRWRKGAPGGKGGQFASNPGLGLGWDAMMIGFQHSLSEPGPCPTETTWNGSLTIEVGAKAGAIISAGVYANATFGINDPVDFDYGFRYGVSGYVGAEIYLDVTGRGSVEMVLN